MAFINVPQEFANKDTAEIVANAGSGGLPLIPPGDYVGVFLKSEMKETSTGGQMLVLTGVITQGEHRDTEFTERLNIINSNPIATKIAYETLAKISKAVGLVKIPTDSQALHNKPMIWKIKTEAGKPYQDKVTGETKQGSAKSILSGYDALPAGALGTAAAFPQAAPAAQTGAFFASIAK